MKNITKNVLRFSWGEVDCPSDKIPPHQRKDGMPDRRYKSGKEWWDWFLKSEKLGELA